MITLSFIATMALLQDYNGDLDLEVLYFQETCEWVYYVDISIARKMNGEILPWREASNQDSVCVATENEQKMRLEILARYRSLSSKAKIAMRPLMEHALWHLYTWRDYQTYWRNHVESRWDFYTIYFEQQAKHGIWGTM